MKIENFDAFLVFTAEKFSNRHLLFAKAVKSSKKPFFFIRTKFDFLAENQGENFSEEKMLLERKASLAKDFQSEEIEIYMISNLHPEKWDFSKLTKAIADALPSAQRTCLCKIPIVQKFIALDSLQLFLKGKAPHMNNNIVIYNTVIRTIINTCL